MEDRTKLVAGIVVFMLAITAISIYIASIPPVEEEEEEECPT
ncbi:MAG: photosystem II reaction center protein PsbN [Candidatus Thorarchaeota archaeon]|nr:MAG: photosystem II reaction center protein PsbN [Candidatus Thorarchaeota archaeon]